MSEERETRARRDEEGHQGTRRFLMRNLSRVAMFGGLVAGYGFFAALAARFLYPSDAGEGRWLFLADPDELDRGDGFTWRTPGGASVNVARLDDTGRVSDFVALSSVCPHLGCRVHWEAQNDRFFCPCHNGAFTPRGDPIEGPPAEADQELPAYPLKIEGGLLYIQVPEEFGARAAYEDAGDGPPGPGHDPCLHKTRKA